MNADETITLPFPTVPREWNDKARARHKAGCATNGDANFGKRERGTSWEKSRKDGVNASIPNALFNDIDPRPTHILARESHTHRRVITLAEQGYNNREISAAVGISVKYIGTILKQPFAREHIVKTLQEDVSQEIKNFLEAEVLPSLRVVKDIRDNDLAKSSDRLAAANVFLDRHMGKPNQPFTMPQTQTRPLSELTTKELDELLAAEQSRRPDPAPEVSDGATPSGEVQGKP